MLQQGDILCVSVLVVESKQQRSAVDIVMIEVNSFLAEAASSLLFKCECQARASWADIT